MTGLCALFWIAVVTLAWIACNLLIQPVSKGAGSAEQASPSNQ